MIGQYCRKRTRNQGVFGFFQNARRAQPTGGKMTSTAILMHLKKHGQLLDSEIAAMTRIPLDEIRQAIEELSRCGEISRCSVTRYKNGTPVEGVQCRISGYYPPAAPGRKPAH
jgi:hypothetical protein